MDSPVPTAIIGLGNMGSIYARLIRGGEIPGLELVAACDSNPGKLEPHDGVARFEDAGALLASGLARAVLVVTPHYSHTTLGAQALRAGMHVLVDKPISVHKADALRLLAAHDGSRVFAAMFNQRLDPRYIRLRQMITGGELGAIQRVSWTITDWFRSEAYYRSGGWRATWAGEGGGVLLNQCPHQLDLWQWLFGMPARVRAFCALGKHHAIEVEDDVTAFMEYENGATGVFTTTTGEAPGVNRLEVAGDNGLVVVEGPKLAFTRNLVPTSEFSRTTAESFAAPPTERLEESFDDTGPQHAGVLRNFAAAILRGEPLVAQAREGLASVELANAMLISSLASATIDLPLDAATYEMSLRARVAASPRTPTNARPTP